MGLLRTYLALSVVLVHAGPFYGMHGMGAEVAVQTFFIISGFYMTLILTDKYNGADGTRLYFVNRFLRIFPAYWIVALATLSYLVYFAPEEFSCAESGLSAHCVIAYDFVERYMQLQPGALAYLVGANVSAFGQDATLFLAFDESGSALQFTSNFWRDGNYVYPLLLVPQAWSVSLELLFYVLAPLLVRRSFGLVLAVCAASVCVRVIIYQSIGGHDPWNYRFFPTELALFCAGILSCKLYQQRLRSAPMPIAVAVSSVLLALAAVYHWWRLPGGPWSFFIVAAFCLPFVFRATKGWRLDTMVGELSYPLFLVHILIVTIAVPIVAGTRYEGHLSLITVVSSVAMAGLLWWFVVRPIDARRNALAGARTIEKRGARA